MTLGQGRTWRYDALRPIAVFPDNRLLCGRRRLEASRLLGLPTIPFHVTETRDDALSRLEAERDENTCRKDMTPEEKVDLGLQLEELERPKAEERKAASRFGGAQMGPTAKPATNRTAQVVGEALGLSKNTYKRATWVPGVGSVAQNMFTSDDAAAARRIA